MKRITAIFIFLSVLIVLSGYSGAVGLKKNIASYYTEIPGITEAETEAIELLKKTKDGFSYGHLLETEAYKLTDGTYAGFTIELCKLLTELFGAEFSPRYFDEWTEMQNALDNCDIDFSGGFTQNEERFKKYYMTIPIAGRNLKLYTLAEKATASANELNGKKIGVLHGSALADAVTEYYPEFSFEVVNFFSYSEGVSLLESGAIDAVIATSASAPLFESYDFLMQHDFFSLAYYPVSVTTADSELLPIISVIDKYLESGGINKVFNLYAESEWAYKKNSLLRSFTAAETDYLNKIISENLKIDIGLQHDAYPASFYNVSENEYQGVSIDILKEITNLTGLEFEPLSTSETTTLATILEKLKDGEIAMMTQLLKTESRKNDYIWSEVPYLTTNYALLSRIDYANIKIYQVPWEKIGTVKKSAHEVMFETWFPNHRNQIIYDTTNEAFDALEKGEIDLVMLSENMLLQQTNLREKTGFKVNLRFDVSLDSFFGFSKDEEILRSITDKAMTYVNINEIADRWMNRVFDYESEISKLHNTYLLYFSVSVFAVFVVLLFLLLRNRRLSKSLMERTTTLSAIYKSIPDTIFSKNTDGVYISCNPSFEKQAGMAEAEIVGKTYAEVFRERVEKTVSQYREIDKKIIKDRIINTVEEEVVFPDGSRKLFETINAPLIQNDVVVGIIGMGRDVTERKEIQSRLDNIVNAAQIAFVLTVDGIIAETNEYCREYIGMTIGSELKQFLIDFEQRETIIGQTEINGASSNNVINVRMINGETHRFLTNITVIEYEKKKANVVWAIDIEQDEKRSDLIREMQISFQTVLETLPMPIRIVDLESREIVYVNGSLLELLEYDSPDELCGLKINCIIPEILNDGSKSESHEEQLLSETTNTTAVDMEYLTKSGRIIEAIVVARNIDYNGRRSSIGIIKDLTEEKRTAQMLRESAEREKEANQAKSMFLANMSHEIRTPMNGIIGMTDLLLTENLTGRQLQYGKDIKASAESLLNIINDILDLSKINDGKLQITPVDIDLNLMLKNTVSMMRFSAQSKGLQFIDDIQISMPEYVRTDDVRLNQIIINLLSNAIKFTVSGWVKLTVKIEGGNISIKVQDTGIGIKNEDIKVIFSAFEQADKHRNRMIKGTGLGLSITRSLTELMGGKIWVESEYNAGSTFYVTLPYIPGDESAVQLKDFDFEYIYAPDAQILLVDDIQSNLTVCAGLLSLCGITADLSLSGKRAVEMVREKDYDLVFMDHMMPDLDGIETMNIIRELGEKYRKLPIIALTANAVSESQVFLLSSGMNDFLSKPINKSDLMLILKKWLPAGRIKDNPKPKKKEQEKPYSETLQAAAKIEGLDIKLALNRIGEIQSVLEKSLKQTAYLINDKLKSMEKHLNNENMTEFAFEAHSLKGVLANIGASVYSESSAELEAGAKAGNIKFCREKFNNFAKMLNEFGNQLKECFEPEEYVIKPAGDPEFFEKLVTASIDYLNSFEASNALFCLNELTEFTYGAAADESLNNAKKAAERYGYDEAIESLYEAVDKMNLKN